MPTHLGKQLPLKHPGPDAEDSKTKKPVSAIQELTVRRGEGAGRP